jgi:hypothetical protein
MPAAGRLRGYLSRSPADYSDAKGSPLMAERHESE